LSARKWPGPSGSSNDDAWSHAVALVAFPALLGLFGAWIDSRTDTRPLFLLVLAALGVVGSFASAFYRYEARMAQHDDGKPWMRRQRQQADVEKGARA
jgi:F0F1-type ATP synthase assembly protein I